MHWSLTCQFLKKGVYDGAKVGQSFIFVPISSQIGAEYVCKHPQHRVLLLATFTDNVDSCNILQSMQWQPMAIKWQPMAINITLVWPGWVVAGEGDRHGWNCVLNDGQNLKVETAKRPQKRHGRTSANNTKQLNLKPNQRNWYNLSQKGFFWQRVSFGKL